MSSTIVLFVCPLHTQRVPGSRFVNDLIPTYGNFSNQENMFLLLFLDNFRCQKHDLEGFFVPVFVSTRGFITAND